MRYGFRIFGRINDDGTGYLGKDGAGPAAAVIDSLVESMGGPATSAGGRDWPIGLERPSLGSRGQASLDKSQRRRYNFHCSTRRSGPAQISSTI